MRFMRNIIRPTPIERTARRMKNAEKAVRRERDDIPLFPELMRFTSASERLDQIDAANMAYWRRIRDCDARMWRKFRRRLYGLPERDRSRFLDYWNAHVMIPGEACYASDTLTNFFDREDWLAEDREEMAKEAAK